MDIFTLPLHLPDRDTRAGHSMHWTLRMSFLKQVVLLMLVCISMSSYAKDATIQSRQLARDIWLLHGPDAGTNIGLLRVAGEWLLIDPMPGAAHLSDLHQHLRARMRAEQLYLLNTHGHDDHSGGNANLIENGAQLLENAHGLSALRQLAVRSHTASDKLFFHPAGNVMFVGDVIDGNWHPTFYAGGLAGLEQAVALILQTGDETTLIVPGHGPTLSKQQVREFLGNTQAWYARVNALHIAGKDVPTIMGDTELRAVLERFNLTGRRPFLPESAVQRFVERTLAMQMRH